MSANMGPLAPVLRSRQRIYETYNILKQSEDQMLREYGLTVEQLSVLSVVSYLKGSARIADIAEWLERSANSISMIVDRMVKAGLVRRARDRVDRRVVFVSATGKGEAAFRPAYPAMIEFDRKIFQRLSEAEMNTMAGLLGTVKYEVLKSGNPELDIKEVERKDSKKLADMERWLSGSGLLSVPEAKSRSKTKSKGADRAR
jgi:DNA-binding MarR family transcriptional regulator